MGRENDRMKPVLKNLHWLPVRYRIHFRILPLTFKSLTGMAPAYFMDLINARKHARYSLHSVEFRYYSITSSRKNKKNLLVIDLLV